MSAQFGTRKSTRSGDMMSCTAGAILMHSISAVRKSQNLKTMDFIWTIPVLVCENAPRCNATVPPNTSSVLPSRTGGHQ